MDIGAGGGLGRGKVISVFNFHPLSEVQKPRLSRSFIASNSDSSHPAGEFRVNLNFVHGNAMFGKDDLGSRSRFEKQFRLGIVMLCEAVTLLFRYAMR